MSQGFVCETLRCASLTASHHFDWVKQLSSSPGAGCIPRLSDSSHRSNPSPASAWGARCGVLLLRARTDMGATFPTLGAGNAPGQGETGIEVPAEGAHRTQHPITV